MAISKENKARSTQCYGPGTGIAPRPDAPFAAGHAAHIAWLYAGGAYGAGATGVTLTADFRLELRVRRRA